MQENLDSEIMQVVLEEAREAYDAQIVVELESNTAADLESNVARIETWLKQWKADRAVDGGRGEDEDEDEVGVAHR